MVGRGSHDVRPRRQDHLWRVCARSQRGGQGGVPLFALVMAYNLARPGADSVKSVRRLGMWGLIAQPVHVLAFGYWLPLNILLTFALCAAAIYAAGQRRWVVLAFAAVVLPAFVDYQWAGVGFVLLAWLAFHRQQYWLLVPAFAAICWFNGNLWALGRFRWRWACLGWRGRSHGAGGPSMGTTWAIWRALGCWPLYSRHEPAPIPRCALLGRPMA